MRFDEQDRIMSFSYQRDPQDHIDAMHMAMRRWLGGELARGDGIYAWLWLIGYVVAFGVLMELYRRHVLTYFAEITTIPTFAIAMLQVVPVIAIIYLLLMMHGRWQARRDRKMLEARMAEDCPVRLDIYRNGICATIGKTAFQLEWISLSDVFISRRRISFDSDTWHFYIPVRAFDGPEDYATRAREIRTIWKNAVEAKAAPMEEAIGS